MLTKNQKRILLACAVLGGIGAIILAIDNFIVNPDRASEQDLIAEAADELRLELHQPYAQAEQLIEILQGLGEPVKPATEIGRVLKREDELHRLWVYEHRYHPGVTAEDLLGSRSRDVQLLGILIESRGSALPPLVRFPNGQFETSDRERLERLVTPDLALRLTNLDEFSLVSAGQYLVMLSKEPLVPLTAVIERRRNPQFADGLANAALKIDVQRAIDIFNLLQPDQRPIADVNVIRELSINVEVNRPELDYRSALDRARSEYEQGREERRTQSEANLERIRAENEARMAALRQQQEAATAQRRADFQATAQEFRDNLARSGSQIPAENKSESVNETLPDAPEQPPSD